MTNFTLILPDHVKPFTDVMILALTIYREASGETLEGKRAVAWTVKNRALQKGWFGKDYVEVCTKKAQFTSMVPPDGVDDPNLRRYPHADESAWKECLQAAFDVIVGNVADATYGSTHYYAPAGVKTPPAWALEYTNIANIGGHKFYKAKEKH